MSGGVFLPLAFFLNKREDFRISVSQTVIFYCQDRAPGEGHKLIVSLLKYRLGFESCRRAFEGETDRGKPKAAELCVLGAEILPPYPYVCPRLPPKTCLFFGTRASYSRHGMKVSALKIRGFLFKERVSVSLRHSFILSLPSPSFPPTPLPQISHNRLVNSIFLLHWF